MVLHVDFSTGTYLTVVYLERFVETKKRSEAEGEQRRQTKRRRSGNDAAIFEGKNREGK